MVKQEEYVEIEADGKVIGIKKLTPSTKKWVNEMNTLHGVIVRPATEESLVKYLLLK